MREISTEEVESTINQITVEQMSIDVKHMSLGFVLDENAVRMAWNPDKCAGLRRDQVNASMSQQKVSSGDIKHNLRNLMPLDNGQVSQLTQLINEYKGIETELERDQEIAKMEKELLTAVKDNFTNNVKDYLVRRYKAMYPQGSGAEEMEIARLESECRFTQTGNVTNGSRMDTEVSDTNDWVTEKNTLLKQAKSDVLTSENDTINKLVEQRNALKGKLSMKADEMDARIRGFKSDNLKKLSKELKNIERNQSYAYKLRLLGKQLNISNLATSVGLDLECVKKVVSDVREKMAACTEANAADEKVYKKVVDSVITTQQLSIAPAPASKQRLKPPVSRSSRLDAFQKRVSRFLSLARAFRPLRKNRPNTQGVSPGPTSPS